jgi:hypothetical protein
MMHAAECLANMIDRDGRLWAFAFARIYPYHGRAWNSFQRYIPHYTITVRIQG